MKAIFFMLILFPLAYTTYAQEYSKIIKLNPGDTLTQIVDKNFQYAYKNFSDGIVVYKNNDQVKGRLNYNYLTREMQFLNPDNKILTLTNLDSILVVVINRHKFVPAGHYSEFLELVSEGTVCVAENKYIQIITIGSKNLYGSTATSSELSTVNNYYKGDVDLKLNYNSDIMLKKHTEYYITSMAKKVAIKEKIKNILEFYPPENSDAIKYYMSNNKIDLSKRNDLIKLIAYSNSLIKK